MTPALELLYASQDLSSEQTEELFTKIFNGETDPAVFASILTALKMKGEAPSEIAGAARAMVRAARHFPRPEGIEIGEIVGTGGDGKQPINVSPIAALGAASNGLFIAKHGNRSVSSKTGASDLLTALGFNIAPDPEQAAELLVRTGFAFCFAQLYHTSMKNVMPVRSALATRTIFNILGPLTKRLCRHRRLRHGSDQTGRTNAQRTRHETRFCRTRQRLRRSFRFRSFGICPTV